MSSRYPTVLMTHNYYRSASPSGENASFDDELSLLRSGGHTVHTYTRHNDKISTGSLQSRISLVCDTISSPRTVLEVRQLLATQPVDLVHVQNTFPLLSPSIFSICRESGIPVVASLRNFRLLCPAASLYRDNHVCEDCLGRAFPWPALLHRCYRNSAAQTAVIAASNFTHQTRGTWRNSVTLFLAPSDFVRRKFISAGFPAEKIRVKPNFVHPDPGPRSGPGSFALFIGRLSLEKGISTLLDAWERLPHIPLRIIGDGPLASVVQRRLASPFLQHVRCLGALPRAAVHEALGDTRFIVIPSVVYETFGRVAIEAFAHGVPVLASNLGALPEIVSDGHTGMLFPPAGINDLVATAASAWQHHAELARMGRAARAEFESRYTVAANYRRLLEIYSEALGHRSALTQVATA